MKARIWYNGIEDRYYPQFRFLFSWFCFPEGENSMFVNRFNSLDEAKKFLDELSQRKNLEKQRKNEMKKLKKSSRVVFTKTY